MSVRKAQTDFFSPMTGNVFRDNRRRADLIMEAAKVDMIKTDDPEMLYDHLCDELKKRRYKKEFFRMSLNYTIDNRLWPG